LENSNFRKMTCTTFVVHEIRYCWVDFCEGKPWAKIPPPPEAAWPWKWWVGLYASMNLWAAMTVLVTGRIFHVTVVTGEMPD
jgi:hypothetical protein